MKINVETVSEEQVLFNKLSYEEQQFILKQMRMLQPCELSCEVEEKKIPEKLSILQFSDLIDMSKEELIETIKEQRFKINEIIDYLKSKGE